ncbi:hypothetical protein BMF94_1952 [Rhodotorula taiwanensis]|uniref:Uncharacterized protein n=1 Tax=Rhodotorula taiwanensis TaxID=741276 RepID=A0A2S5BDW7_9BASI|nr:hypothetical protein BMF94_1952 [Rhodotorula taiwanensis]
MSHQTLRFARPPPREDNFPTFPHLTSLILIESSIRISRQVDDFATVFPKLEQLTSVGSLPVDLWLLAEVSVVARSAIFYTNSAQLLDVRAVTETNLIPTPSRLLQSCTFTLLRAGSSPTEPPASLQDAQVLSNKIYEGTECTVRCNSLDATIEETVERVLADRVI